TENADGEFFLTRKRPKRCRVQRRNWIEQLDLLIQPAAQFVITGIDPTVTRMRFQRHDPTMKLGFPRSEYRPVPKLSLHKLGAHRIEAKAVNKVVGSFVIQGREVMGSTAEVGCSRPDPVIEIPDGVNSLRAHRRTA